MSERRPVEVPDAVWYCVLCAFCGTESEADAHLVVKPTHILSPLRTPKGRIISTAELDRWVADAERGYDVSRLRPEPDHPGWAKRRCGTCRGHGVVDGYDAGPLDCRWCNGGTVWISPSGRHALWPGGPFTGDREPVTS